MRIEQSHVSELAKCFRELPLRSRAVIAKAKSFFFLSEEAKGREKALKSQLCCFCNRKMGNGVLLPCFRAVSQSWQL